MFEMVLSSIAALSLITLGIHAIIKQRTAVNALLLFTIVLLVGIEIADQLSLQTTVDFDACKQITLYLEALLPGSFLLLSLMYGRIRPFSSLSKKRLGLMAVTAAIPMCILLIADHDLYYSPDVQYEKVIFLGNAGYWYYIGITASLIVSLVNVENTLAETHGIARHRMKFETFGIMSLLAVLIFYYSQGLLYRTINMDLIPIRSSVFIVASILIGYSQAFRGSGIRVAISRHILYRSITMLIVGIYLIGLGLVGEGMRYFGVAFGRNLTIALAFVGGVLLLAILYSEQMRRRMKVYISKHFYSNNKHDYREEWIKFTNRLSSCKTLHDVQESILTVYRETFGLAGAALYLLTRDERRYVRVAEQGMDKGPDELHISGELASYFMRRERVLDLTDGEFRLSLSDVALFRQMEAWLIVPLISGSKIEGLAVLREQLVPELLIYDDYDLMKVLARQAAQAITNLRLSEEIIEMRAMAAVSRISTFVIHDLKNLTTSLSLVVDNAEEYIGNPDFQQDAIKTIRNTLLKMKGLMQRLKSIPEKRAIDAKIENIDRLSRSTLAEFSKAKSGKRIVYHGVPVYSCVDGEDIKKVVFNLVQNALEASDEKEIVEVRTLKENGRVCIRVSDNGTGMSDDFIKTHLFRPFRTTKEKGLGIGLYQCKQIVEAHDGSVEVKSEPGKGTVFSVYLPGADDQGGL
jgi:putative PEP-CTERM system histidine kinase